jgi:P pilus assembly chaperone PapD
MLETKNRFFSITAGCLFFTALQILAASNQAVAGYFSVSPMVTISDTKGSQAKGAINVTNNGTEPVRMRIYAEDFTYERTKGYVTTSKHERSAIPYIQFSPRELTVPPGVTRNVRVGITLPPSAPDGEYRAAIFVDQLSEQEVKTDAPKKNQVVMLARVASVFFIAKGGVKANLQVNSAIWNNQQKNLNIVLTNQGKKSAYPNVFWKISQNGKEINDGSILGVVLQSDTDREVTLRTKDKNLSLPSGNYQLSGEIVNNGQKPVPFSIGVSIP